MEVSPDAFVKRVRRQVGSRNYTFLAVVQPALRGICREELEEGGFMPGVDVDGGVEFSGSLRDGWRANLFLRTASRVYCRAVSFRSGAREELFRRVSAFPWELWLPAAPEILLEVKVRASRIRHEGAAKEAFFDALARHYTDAGLPPPRELRQWKTGCQRILLRIIENTAQISLDMSGMPLYTRGYRSGGGEAPLRETLAAALLRELGWQGQGILVDGMTGSGTLAIEAACIAEGLPPGGKRDFQFQSWPSFGESGWAYMKRKAAEKAETAVDPVSREKKAFLFAADISGQALSLARKNAARAGVENAVHWETRDFFTLTAADIKSLRTKGESSLYLVLNPPYGKRLEGGEDLYRSLGRHIRQSFADWKTLALFPDTAALGAFGGSPRKTLRLRHGGLNITAGFFNTSP